MDKPSYYAIIPASVRYDTTLRARAILLYGEITALCYKEGYCWSTNEYFAKLYGIKNPKTAGVWVNQLRKRGHIRVVMEYAPNSKRLIKRRLYLTGNPTAMPTDTPPLNNVDPTHLLEDTPPPNNGEPPHQKVEDNNTVNNTTNITVNNNDHFDAFWSAYPVKKGKLAARKAWDKLKLSDDVVKLIAENMKARMDAGEWEDKQYIPHPATFLNGRRWEDEVTPAKQSIRKNSIMNDVNDRSWAENTSIRKRNIEDALTDTTWVTGG